MTDTKTTGKILVPAVEVTEEELSEVATAADVDEETVAAVVDALIDVLDARPDKDGDAVE